MTRRTREIAAVLLCVLGLIGLIGCSGDGGGAGSVPTTTATTTARPPAPPPPDLPPLDLRLLPLPLHVAPDADDAYHLTSGTRIIVPAQAEEVIRIGDYLADAIDRWVGRSVPVHTGGNEPGAISLELVDNPEQGAEGYLIDITRDGVRLQAAEPAGLFRAVQTIQQILPTAKETGWLPGGRIEDRPRFAWRGAMLDVARHFFDVEDVEHYIDLMALYRLNVLHLHLTDDQGWRIAIDSWPQLTTDGGASEVGGGPGGFYTAEEYAEIVSYAADRYITVVPEIDMPGHTNAALSSYGELTCDGRAPDPYTGTHVGFSSLCVTKEVTYRLVDEVIGELAALTPGPYIHIGGDEVQRLSDAEYADFIARVGRIVESHRKRLVGWQEVAEADLPPSSVVQVWNPHVGPEQAKRAMEQGAGLVLSPADHVYLDMKYDESTRLGTDWAGYVDVAAAYRWDPATLLDGVTEEDVTGVEAPLWTETVDTMDEIEFMAFPRLAAASEVAWTAADQREWDGFRQRLAQQAPLWAALGVDYYAAPEISWPR